MQALQAALRAMKCIGMDTIVVDVVWGHVEGKAPRKYSWEAHEQIFQMLKDIGLQARISFCFHATSCISLPPWVLEEGVSNPDLFFCDRTYVRCLDCLTFGIDERMHQTAD
jgi:beta-amylase